MKKIFVCLLAVAALASCQKNEVISTVQGPAIAFENTFVDNATKAAADPSYNATEKMFDKFYVWGYMDQASGIVFSEELVSSNGTAWTYANTQYWAANHTYTFEAVTATDYEAATVNVTDATADVVSVDFVNADGTNDLLYATAQVETGADVSAMDPVELVFNHLLSKVKFSFTNGFGNENAYITVTGIKMTAPGAGTYTVDDAWTLGDTETVLAFGDMEEAKIGMAASTECQYERLTIPATDQAYTVTFDVELFMGSASAYKNTLTTVIEGAVLEAGKAYNFHATIDASNIVPGDGENDELKRIEFTATVEDWVDGGIYDGGVIETITAEDALVAALAEGGYITLTEDVVLTKTLKVATDATLDLNGMTITNQKDNAETDVFIVAEGATLTIEGEGVVEAVSGNDGYAVIADGTVVINGGTFKAGVDADNAANAVVYVRGNGKAYVNGGTFPNENNSAYVLNKKDQDRATTVIEVTGGTFTGFNPANNAAEGLNTNFLKAGYTVAAEGNTYTVVAE